MCMYITIKRLYFLYFQVLTVAPEPQVLMEPLDSLVLLEILDYQALMVEEVHKDSEEPMVFLVTKENLELQDFQAVKVRTYLTSFDITMLSKTRY